jgi:hypothetical protein
VPRRDPIYKSDRIELPLTRGLIAIVDLDCDKSHIAHTWTAQVDGRTAYATRNDRSSGRSRAQLLHRVILGLDYGDPRKVDHINRDGLDCRIANMRICEQWQNMANQGSRSGKYRGVSKLPSGRWIARMVVQGKSVYVGVFDTDAEAALAWDKVAAVTFDPAFVKLNFPSALT